jgi:hypothetical protein
VVTFKPAVEDAWQTDLESHADFDGWQYLSSATGGSPDEADKTRPLVYFGSFQDLLGRDRKTGLIKAKNEWVHTTNWDLVIFDEYHFGAWRESAKELFEGEDEKVKQKELAAEYNDGLVAFDEELDELGNDEDDFLPITTRAYLYLSGTPFKALATGEFIEEQIFNWTYTDEQRAKAEYAVAHPDAWNPYGALPEMRLFTYQMPDELIAVANQGEFDEFDLNEFFEAKGIGKDAEFTHKTDVQKWLDLIRGAHLPTQVDAMRMGTRPPFPYSDVRLLPYLQHSFWFLPNVAACEAMANLLAEKQNVFWHDYQVLVVAGAGAGIGLDALPPVRAAIGDGHDTKTITLSCGKLTTGVTVKQWSSILMLRNLNSPETYFQAAFRVQSPWSIKNPDGDNPNAEAVLKPVCFVFDFAPTRALRQIADYGAGLSPETPNPEQAVEELVKFLPVLAYDGSNMTQVDAGGILDIAMSGTSATLLARKWESAILVNVDNDTLRKIMNNPRRPQRRHEHRRLPRARQRHLRDRREQERRREEGEEGEGRGQHSGGEEGTHGGGEGVQVQAEADSGEAGQVRHPHPGVHVPHRLPREHPSGRHHQARTGPVPHRHRADRRGLPPAREPRRLQRHPHEPSRLRLPPLRRLLPVLHRHRVPQGPASLRPLRHRGRRR